MLKLTVVFLMSQLQMFKFFLCISLFPKLLTVTTAFLAKRKKNCTVILSTHWVICTARQLVWEMSQTPIPNPQVSRGDSKDPRMYQKTLSLWLQSVGP